jgi:hypothetical protein
MTFHIFNFHCAHLAVLQPQRRRRHQRLCNFNTRHRLPQVNRRGAVRISDTQFGYFPVRSRRRVFRLQSRFFSRLFSTRFSLQLTIIYIINLRFLSRLFECICSIQESLHFSLAPAFLIVMNESTIMEIDFSYRPLL